MSETPPELIKETEPIQFEIGVQKNADSDPVWLRYELLPGAFPQQWLTVLINMSQYRTILGYRFGSDFVDEAGIREEINALLKKLGSHIGAIFKETKKNASFNFKEESFEIIRYVPRNTINRLLKFNSKLLEEENTPTKARSIITELNLALRDYAQIYYPEFHYQISLTIPGGHQYCFPKNVDTLFTMDRHDGWLYLDYVPISRATLDPVAGFNEQNSHDVCPPTYFSSKSQILYRDELDGTELQQKIQNWCEQNGVKRTDSGGFRIGMIPLARPLHGVSRSQMGDLFTPTIKGTEARVRVRCLSEFSLEGLAKVQRHYPSGLREKLMYDTICLLGLERLYNRYLDYYCLYGQNLVSRLLWYLSQPVHPIYYYTLYQYRTGFRDYRSHIRRILKVDKIVWHLKRRYYVARVWTRFLRLRARSHGLRKQL